MQNGLRKTMIANTIANYVKLILGFIIAVFLTRLLFMGLTREEYGMWALLWTIFGYSVLLDFGFGTAVQKATSETVVNKDWKYYNRLVSTVFFNYVFLAAVIMVFTVIMSQFIDRIFNFTDQHQIRYYKNVFLIFGIGTSLGFPFGVTLEILLGLNEIKLRNMIQIGSRLLTFIALYTIVSSGLSIKEMAIATISVNMLANSIQTWFCFKKVPTLKISLKFYDRTLVKKVMSFSIFAYIIIFTNLIIFRTDQLVISISSSVTLVAVYQIASRLAETFKQFSTQFLDNLKPVAATLFASRKDNKLGQILLESNRLQGFIATLIIIPLLVYMKPLLNIWLELKDPAGIISAIILLFSMYVYVYFRSSSIHIILMSEKYKTLAVIAVVECLMNLIISIILIRHIGIIGVAIGTLFPNLLAAVFFNIPSGCRFAGVPFSRFFKLTIFRTIWIGTITAILVYGISLIHHPEDLLQLLIHFIVAATIYLILYYFFGIYSWERNQFNNYLKSKLGRIGR